MKNITISVYTFSEMVKEGLLNPTVEKRIENYIKEYSKSNFNKLFQIKAKEVFNNHSLVYTDFDVAFIPEEEEEREESRFRLKIELMLAHVDFGKAIEWSEPNEVICNGLELYIEQGVFSFNTSVTTNYKHLKRRFYKEIQMLFTDIAFELSNIAIALLDLTSDSRKIDYINKHMKGLCFTLEGDPHFVK